MLERFVRGNHLLEPASARPGYQARHLDYRHQWAGTNEFSRFHLTWRSFRVLRRMRKLAGNFRSTHSKPTRD